MMAGKPKNTEKTKSSDIIAALKDRYYYNSCGFFTEVETGIDDISRGYRIDAVLLHRADRKISLEGFEVKISRGDFLRDTKWQFYKDYVNALSVVCPLNMIRPEEVPEEFGLMYYSPKTHKVRFKRRPQVNPDADIQSVKDTLLTKLSYMNTSRTYRYDKFPNAEAYVKGKEMYEDIGRVFGTRMAKDLQKYKDMLKHPDGTPYGRFYDAVRKIMSERNHWIPPIDGTGSEDDVQLAIDKFKEAVVSLSRFDEYRNMLESLKNGVDYELEKLDRIEGKVPENDGVDTEGESS